MSYSKRVSAAALGATLGLGAILLLGAAAPDSDPRLNRFTDQSVEHTRSLAMDAGHKATDAELLSVLAFRHICQVTSEVAQDPNKDPLLAAAVGLLDEIDQAATADFVRTSLLPKAERNDVAGLASFVEKECDPSQDMSAAVGRKPRN